MIIKIRMLQFLLIKYFTVSMCELLALVQPVLSTTRTQTRTADGKISQFGYSNYNDEESCNEQEN